jgi:hypothetical protein
MIFELPIEYHLRIIKYNKKKMVSNKKDTNIQYQIDLFGLLLPVFGIGVLDINSGSLFSCISKNIFFFTRDLIYIFLNDY